MEYEEMTKEQLLQELHKLRQDNILLTTIIEEKGRFSTEYDLPLSRNGLYPLRTEAFYTKRTKQEEKDIIGKAFYSNPEIMAITTMKEGRFVEVNDAFIATFGYKRSEIIGHSVYELDIWPDPKKRDETIEQTYMENVQDIEIELKTKGGKIGILLVSCEAIELNNEECLIIVAKDITERKRMEKALRLSEECLFKAFNTSPVVMAITTLEEGRFIRANQAFGRVVGYNHQGVIGKTSLEIGFWIKPQEREAMKNSIAAGHSVRDMEITFGRIGGKQGLGLLSAEGIENDGQACVLCVFTDITEQRRMEAEILRLDRLNLVGEMAASIGHEIRNPMTTVRGYLQLMREDNDNVKEKGYFDLMIEELDRANGILTDFLSLAKDKVTDIKPRDLNAIVNKALPLIQAKALGMDHYIKLELGDIPPVRLDDKEIHQLILNLVNNGLESMALPGYVTLRTYREADEVVLAVQDQGEGIEPSLLDKLGTPFLTTKEEGTGLGLAVCYRIVLRHNAKVNIESSAEGSTFYIKFPLKINRKM